MAGGILSVRCGIYTRKSTDHRLTEEANSLVMQREICSAYVNSQQYKNWIEIPDRYDDGGHSGSGLERPALAQLMQDIEVGKIDAVVVYKIDRLTRSLPDFVRLMELFDRRDVALVSISQAFDTSDSMGRMILNILLTFAQFERELIAERIKDSIQTRKRHGQVHGGPIAFGYLRTDHGIKIDVSEAKIVQFIFDKYLKHKRYVPVVAAVQKAGFHSSVKTTKKGKKIGGTLLAASHVYSILRNPFYIGEIRGHGKNYVGRHEPIIERKIWEAVQSIRHQRKKRGPHPKRTEHFLAGLLWDDLGRHMKLEIYKTRKNQHAAYVSSNAAWSIKEFRRSYRCKAEELDASAVAVMSEFLGNRGKLRRALREIGLYGTELETLTVAGKGSAQFLQGANASQMREIFIALLIRIEVGHDELTFVLRGLELRRFLEWGTQAPFQARPSDWPVSNTRYTFSTSVCATTTPRSAQLQLKPAKETSPPNRNMPLVSLVKQARKAQQLIDNNRDCSIADLARMQGCKNSHFVRLVGINYLAPDIVAAIFDGTQPDTFDRALLMRTNISTDWAVQRRQFGFSEHERAPAENPLYGRGHWPSRR